MRKRPYSMDLERAKMTSCQKSSRIHQIHITGDAQDTLFSPRQLTAFMSCLDVPGHLLRPLESDGDCRRGCWGLLTHRKLGAMTRRAEKPTWHISRCRHIRTDIFFDCETLFGVPTWQHVPTWQPAARPLWRLSGWRLPRWDLGGLCWEIAMKQIILLTNEIQWNPIYLARYLRSNCKFRESNWISSLHPSLFQLVWTTSNFHRFCHHQLP